MLLTTIVAAYGAVLSTALGYLTWRRDRRRVQFSTRYVRSAHDARLEISAVNTGLRPVSLESAHFEQADGGGYLPTLDDELGLPVRLAEGDVLTMRFDEVDLANDVIAFVLRGYDDREYRHEFEPRFRAEWADGHKPR